MSNYSISKHCVVQRDEHVGNWTPSCVNRAQVSPFHRVKDLHVLTTVYVAQCFCFVSEPSKKEMYLVVQQPLPLRSFLRQGLKQTSLLTSHHVDMRLLHGIQVYTYAQGQHTHALSRIITGISLTEVIRLSTYQFILDERTISRYRVFVIRLATVAKLCCTHRFVVNKKQSPAPICAVRVWAFVNVYHLRSISWH